MVEQDLLRLIEIDKNGRLKHNKPTLTFEFLCYNNYLF